MKLEIQRKEFIDVLAGGSQFAGRNKTMAVLNNVKITVKGNQISVSSFDLENAIVKRGQVISSEEDICFLVDAKDLLITISSLKDENIALYANVVGGILEIVHTKGKMTLPISSGNTFPTPQKEENMNNITLPSETLYNWLKIAVNFVATDNIRPTMTGVYLLKEGGKIWCAATDAHQLFSDYIECESGDDKVVDTILSPSAVKAIMNMINETTDVTLSIGTKNTIVRTKDSTLSTRKIEGRYPNFRGIIPKESSIKLNVNKDDITDSVKRAIITANIGTSLLKMKVDGVSLKLESEDLDFAKKTDETIFCNSANGEITIGVKGTLFSNILNLINNDTLNIEMNNNASAIVIKAENKPNMTMLVMPMLIND